MAAPMSSQRKDRIRRGFDRARDYDGHANVQRQVADRLAARIAALPLPDQLPGIELGCGTGFLTGMILRDHPRMDLLVTDIAPAMLDRARARHADAGRARFEIVDADSPLAAPGPAPGWGLVASSLVFQWLEDPPATIAGWYAQLAPGGWLAVSTLEQGSFVEWSGALAAAGIAGSTRQHPPALALTGRLPSDAGIELERHTLHEAFPDGRSFLRALQAIGAATAWQGRVGPAPLRSAIRAFEQAGGRVTYRIATLIVRKPDGSRLE